MNKLALSVKEAAEALGVSRQTLSTYIKREGLPAAKINGRVLIPKDAFEKWLNSRTGGTK